MNSGGRTPTSRTIMIPLRDASSPTEQNPRTARGRGSQPNTAKSKRSATPVRKNSRSRSRRQSVTDLNITVLGDEGDSNDWTKQRSPRRRKPTPSRKPQPSLDLTSFAETQDGTAGKPRRRTTRSAPAIEIKEDTDVEEDGIVDAAVESDFAELRSIDLNRVSVRSRSMSSRQRPPNTGHEMEVAEGKTKMDSSIIGEHPKRVSPTGTNYPTPDPSEQDEQEITKPAPSLPDDGENFDTILESEGFTMIDLESIPSARHFFSSPPETQGIVQGPELIANSSIRDAKPKSHPAEAATRPVPSAIPSYLTLPEGESDISSNVPSSPPVTSQTQITTNPSPEAVRPRDTTPLLYSSPKLPSPPRAFQQIKSKDGTKQRESTAPTLAKVVRAGIALQGVLSPRSTKTTPRFPSGTPKERLDNLFEGFDSGTRRELRAGLRFGEELAKRQKSSPEPTKPTGDGIRPGKDTAHSIRDKSSSQQHLPVTQVWRGETVVQHTPAQPTLNEVKEYNISEKAIDKQNRKLEQSEPRKNSSLRKEMNLTSSTPQSAGADARSQLIVDSQKRRELQWQQEREAVSTEIENASSSQVVVIDSDDDDKNTGAVELRPAKEDYQDDQDDVDIWCEEAASCEQRSSKAAKRPLQENTAKQERKLDRAQDALTKPRRSLIPSPWRRGEHVADESSYLTNGEMTGLFYHEPKTKIKFGAAELERQKRQHSSGAFDIDRMIGTPRQPQMPIGTRQSSDEPEIDSPETVDSDARQFQSELAVNQRGAEATMESSKVTEEASSFLEHSTEGPQFEHLEAVSEYTEGESSLTPSPQAIKIPVNFNDSTVSNIAPCLTRSSPSTAPESSRPSTPRSALKGARQSLGLEDANSPAVRKVVFSTHETRVDVAGQEEQLSVQGVASSPEPQALSGFEKDACLSACTVPEESPSQKSGLLGWLWGGSKKSISNDPSATDGANDQCSGWQKTKSFVAHKPPTSRGTNERRQTPSYLLPPSYPSDPTRDTEIPMSTSGDFTNSHFRTLHIIYAKSLRPRFHAPRAHEIRPGLAKLLDTIFEADESQSGLGVFEWKVDETALRVLERFMREIEWGYAAGNEVKWIWTERGICERLFRIVVGEEVRKEEKAAMERPAN